MQVIIMQAIGVLVFLAGSIGLGRWIRRHDRSGTAQNASRISHALFWFALVIPGAIGLFYPGLTAYDDLLGLPRLPVTPIWLATGAVLLFVGLALMMAANRFLIKKGKGAAAFLLTEQLVTGGVYGRTRNPLSLGFYAACLGAGLIAESFTVTLAVLAVLVPVHVFNLKYFEERELELRYGKPYWGYKRQVPFLLPRFRRS